MYSIIHSPNNQYSLSRPSAGTIAGPFNKSELLNYLEDHDCELIFHPADLLFDVATYDDGRVIVLDTILGINSDQLGGHNVSGLPSRYGPEELECTWSVDDDRLSDQAVIAEMIAHGFKHEKFL